jgi:hypothetical protein
MDIGILLNCVILRREAPKNPYDATESWRIATLDYYRIEVSLD